MTETMRIKISPWLISVLVVGALLVNGCANQSDVATPDSATETNAVAEETAAVPAPDSNLQFASLPRLEGQATVELVVEGSPITIEVNGEDAPVTAGNFVDLVQKGVYDGLMFHRVVKEPEPFVAQGGDPLSEDASIPAEQLGTGGFIDPQTGQERYVPLEIKPQGADTPIYSQTLESAGITTPPELAHTRGAVAMARSAMPDSASSQFYITLADLSFLDGNYAVFGYVTEGMEVVDQIQQGDRIESARVVSGLENLQQPGEGN